MLKAVINCHSLPAKENDPLVLVKSAFSFFALRIYDNQTSYSWQKETFVTQLLKVFFFLISNNEKNTRMSPELILLIHFNTKTLKTQNNLVLFFVTGIVVSICTKGDIRYQQAQEKNLWAFAFTVTPASSLHLVSFFFLLQQRQKLSSQDFKTGLQKPSDVTVAASIFYTQRYTPTVVKWTMLHSNF